MAEIISKDNQYIKLATKLQKSKKERIQEGMFLAEGLRICTEAAKNGICKVALMTDEFARKNIYSAQFIASKSEKTFTIDEKLCSKISDTKASQGIFCLCTLLDNRFSNDKIKNSGKYMLLSSLQDPGNIGTIIRGADAFCIDGVIISEDCPDIYSPKVLRSTMGGVFRENIMVCDDIKSAIKALQDKQIKVYAAALYSDSVRVDEADFESGCAAVMGNEGNGISQDVISCCDASVIIPMNPETESFNAAAATTILMWEMFRRK